MMQVMNTEITVIRSTVLHLANIERGILCIAHPGKVGFVLVFFWKLKPIFPIEPAFRVIVIFSRYRNSYILL